MVKVVTGAMQQMAIFFGMQHSRFWTSDTEIYLARCTIVAGWNQQIM